MTEKDKVRNDVQGIVEWFVLHTGYNYHSYCSKIVTESEYCDMIINEVQKQLLKWVSEQQSNYSK